MIKQLPLAASFLRGFQAFLVSFLLVMPTFAQTKMTGEQILKTLPIVEAKGQFSSQIFEANGQTTYVASGRPSFGTWQVQGDKYCSTWPPMNGISCYDVFVLEGTSDRPTKIKWVGSTGDETIDLLEYKN